jgi:hypothetical protein
VARSLAFGVSVVEPGEIAIDGLSTVVVRPAELYPQDFSHYQLSFQFIQFDENLAGTLKSATTRLHRPSQRYSQITGQPPPITT